MICSEESWAWARNEQNAGKLWELHDKLDTELRGSSFQSSILVQDLAQLKRAHGQEVCAVELTKFLEIEPLVDNLVAKRKKLLSMHRSLDSLALTDGALRRGEAVMAEAVVARWFPANGWASMASYQQLANKISSEERWAWARHEQNAGKLRELHDKLDTELHGSSSIDENAILGVMNFKTGS